MDKTENLLGAYAPDFELPGVDGAVHHLGRYLETHRAIAVVFMANQCPYVQQYVDRMKQMQSDFGPQQFTLVGINANDAGQCPEEGLEQMQAFAEKHQLNFPYLRDVTQDVALSFGAQTTPEVFLIDHRSVLRYIGAIDDSCQVHQVSQHYLRAAITQLLQLQEVTVSSTPAVGSPVQWRS